MPRYAGYPLYFDETRSIFIHIPKTAGTSIGKTLYGCHVGHRPWRYYWKINPQKFDSYFKFAVIRDPISRFASAFNFLKTGGYGTWDHEFAEKVLKPFSNANELALALMDGEFQRELFCWEHFRRQADYITDDHGDSTMNLVIRFDRLNEGFGHIAKKLKSDVGSLPHLMKTAGPRRELGFGQQAMNVLFAVYERDFQLWNSYGN